MADTNRRINIWINGSEVKNEVASISRAMKHLRNDLANAKIGSQDYIETTKKIKTLQGVLNEHRKMQGQIATGWTKISGAIKQIAIGNIISNLMSEVGLSISGAFSKITTAFSDFSGGMTNVFTQMDDASLANFSESMKEGAKQVSELGFAMTDVTQALYDAVSAGIPAGDSIAFMNEAAILAKGGVTTLGVAVDGLTTIINAYDLEASESTKVSEAFFTTSKFGKTTVDELASSVGKAAPIAKLLGISYQELLSAGSALTLSGIQTKESFNYLKAAFSNLLKPTADAEVIFKKFGVPMGATALKAAGFSNVLAQLNQLIKEHPDEIAKAIPSVEGLTAIQALSGKGLERYNEILKATMNDTGANSSLQKAYQMQMESFPNVMAAAKEKLNTFAITLGEKLAPYIKAIIPIIGGWTKKIIEGIGWIERNSTTIKTVIKWIGVLGTAIVSYNVIQKAKLVWDKLELAWTERKIAAQKAYNLVMKLNPYTAVIAGLIAAGAAVYAFTTKLTASEKIQEMHNDIMLETNKRMAEEKVHLDVLFKKLNDTNTSTQDRAKLIKQINSEYGSYLPNLLTEANYATESANAYAAINAQIRKKIELQATEEKAADIYKQILEKKDKVKKVIDSMPTSTAGLILDAAIGSSQRRAAGLEKLDSDIKELEAMYSDLTKTLTENSPSLPGNTNTGGNIDPIIATGGGSSDSEIKKAAEDQKKAMDDYMKAYAAMQKSILELQQKSDGDVITEEQKKVIELNQKYDDQLSVIQKFIDELEAKRATKKGLNDEELNMLKSFYNQQYQLIDMNEADIISLLQSYDTKQMTEVASSTADLMDALNANDSNSGYIDPNNAVNGEATSAKTKDPWKVKAEKVIQYADMAKNALSSVFEFQSNKEAAALADFEASTNKKKESLDQRLKKGLISQANYDKQVLALDTKLEAEKKKFAIEEAKRQKKIRLFEAIINTASAVVEALPNVPLSIATGILGGLQIAAIAAQPLPKAAKGMRVNKPTILQAGEAGREIILSNSIVDSPTLGPIADDLARIQEGKNPRWLNKPAAPNYSGMTRAISGNTSQTVMNNTVVTNNTVNNKSIDTMNEKIESMTDNMQKMTVSVEKLKYLKAVITHDQYVKYNEDETLRKLYNGL